jgi:hypothetical protein
MINMMMLLLIRRCITMRVCMISVAKKDETKMGNENILEKSFNKRYI